MGTWLIRDASQGQERVFSRPLGVTELCFFWAGERGTLRVLKSVDNKTR